LRWLELTVQIAEVAKRVHEDVHDGVTRGFSRLSQQGYCYGLQSLFAALVARCQHCISARGVAVEAPIRPIIRSQPNERWVVDLKDIGEDPETGHNVLWVCIDAFSSFVWTRPLFGKTAAGTAECLVQVINENTRPKELGLDNGTEFLDEVCHRVYTELGVRLSRGRPRHPQSQGKCERVHQSIGNKLIDYARTNQGRWVQAVERVTSAHNQSVSSSLGPGLTPFFVYRGYRPYNEREGVATRLETEPAPLVSDELRRELYTRVHNHLVKNGKQMIARQSKRRRVVVQQLPVGSVVKLRAPEDRRDGLTWRVKGVVTSSSNYQYDVQLLTAGYSAGQVRGGVVQQVPHARLCLLARSLQEATAANLLGPDEQGSVEESDVYSVELVFGIKRVRRQALYLTKWLNYPWTASTWEPTVSFTQDVQRALVQVQLPDYTATLREDSQLLFFLQKLEGTCVLHLQP